MSIKDLMIRATEAYERGEPFLMDDEYDALEKLHGQILHGAGEIEHGYRMYSLKKHFVGEESQFPPWVDTQNYVVTPKFDGAAVALYYFDGKLELALTRGDGKKGRDITDKMKLLVNTTIPLQGYTQITGEVVASKDLPNSRNYASGALNLKELQEFESRVREGLMSFIVYGVKSTDQQPDDYEESLLDIGAGWATVLDTYLKDMYPTDGSVFRVSSNKYFEDLGYTEKYPRGAFAYKEVKQGVETTLLDVVWQTGKSGKVTPVAILETVEIDGANVSRATLNNIAYIRGLDLHIGDRVLVIRSGEIIPKIIGKVE